MEIYSIRYLTADRSDQTTQFLIGDRATIMKAWNPMVESYRLPSGIVIESADLLYGGRESRGAVDGGQLMAQILPNGGYKFIWDPEPQTVAEAVVEEIPEPEGDIDMDDDGISASLVADDETSDDPVADVVEEIEAANDEPDAEEAPATKTRKKKATN